MNLPFYFSESNINYRLVTIDGVREATCMKLGTPGEFKSEFHVTFAKYKMRWCPHIRLYIV